MKIILSKLALIVSVVFIISGACNYGLTRFTLALPFMILACWISFKILRNKLLFTGVLMLSAFSIVVNLTLERNPLFFPIIKDGFVEIKNDGYHKSYSDGSGGYSSDSVDTIRMTPVDNAKVRKLSKGERFAVLGVIIRHPDFGTAVDLRTEIGEFSENNYREGINISVNKPVENRLLSAAGHLMRYPSLLVLLPILINQSLPGTKVVVEDDKGVLHEAILNHSIASSRSVSSGEKIRLHCSANSPISGQISMISNKQYCNLQFSGFDKNSPYPKNSPLYGKFADFGVSLDKNGIPDSKVLTYVVSK